MHHDKSIKNNNKARGLKSITTFICRLQISTKSLWRLSQDREVVDQNRRPPVPTYITITGEKEGIIQIAYVITICKIHNLSFDQNKNDEGAMKLSHRPNITLYTTHTPL